MSDKPKKTVEPTFADDLKAWQAGSERQQLKDTYWNAINKLDDRGVLVELRHGLMQLYGDLNTPNKDGLTFFDQPASTKFHGNSLGGLARHCLEVYRFFSNMVKENHLIILEDSVIICALFHDLCKWNLYHPKLTVKGMLYESTPFTSKDECPLGHGEESISILADYIKLIPLEKLIIRWHMAPYDYQWKIYQSNVTKISRIPEWFFCADYMASMSEGADDE
jgi:hypothetical protein